MSQKDRPVMKCRRGFSLAELLMCLALFALVGSLSLLGLQGQRSRFPSQALAEVLLEQLRLARQTAITEQHPVAIGFPSEGGSRACSSGAYWLSGRSLGHPTQIFDFSKEYPGQVVMAGGVLEAGDSIFPSSSGGDQEGFEAQAWLENPGLHGYALTSDPCLIFTGDGGVTSNGIPLHDGAYHLLICGGLEAQPAPAPASPTGKVSLLRYYQPRRATTPRWLQVLPSGAVRLADPPPVALADSPTALAQGASPPPLLPRPPAHPSASLVRIDPRPTTELPGVNVTLAAGQHITLRLEATDSSGRDLYLAWESQADPGNGSSNPGKFTRQGFHLMDWNPRTRKWTASWDWSCPLEAVANDRFRFTCRFSDGLGLVGGSPVNLTLLTVPSSPQVFYSCCAIRWGAATPCNIVMANADGSFPQARVSLASSWANELIFNRQGTLFYHYDGQIYSTSSGRPIASWNKLGSNPPAVSPDGRWAAGDAADPAGNRTAITVHRTLESATNTVVSSRSPVSPIDGWPTGLGAEGGIGAMQEFFSWSPDGHYLMYSNGDGIHLLTLQETAGGMVVESDRRVTGTDGYEQNMLTWKPDSSGFYFSNPAYSGGRIGLVNTTTMAVTPQPQLDPLSEILVQGLTGVTAQPADGGTLWGTQSYLTPEGDRFYVIDSSGNLTTFDATTGQRQTWSHVPAGVQAMRLAAP